MAFRALYTIGGGAIPVKGYGITASEAFDRGDVVAWDSSGTLVEPSDDSSDVLGYSLEVVASGASQGPDTSVCLVVPFIWGVVYATTEVAQTTQSPATTDIGTIRDLDLSSGDWGIHATSSGTSNTPQFRVVDVDTIRNEWHVVIAPAEIADVFQMIDAAV